MVKISVITINYNNAVGLKKTIESAYVQNCKEFEYIIIDGGSKDESIEIIKKYNHFVDYWISEKDNGIYDAMNKGILAAKGKYLQFLNSGDIFYDGNVIKTELKFIDKYHNVDVFYGNIFLLKGNNEKPIFLRMFKDIDVAFFKDCTINHQATLIKRSLFENSLYDISYKAAGDYVKFLQLALNGNIFYHIDSTLVSYDFTGLSSSDEGSKQYQNEVEEYWRLHMADILDKVIIDYQYIKINMSYPLIKKTIYVHSLMQRFKKNIKKSIKHIFKAIFVWT